MKDFIVKFLIIIIGFTFLTLGLFYAKKAYAYKEFDIFNQDYALLDYESFFDEIESKQFLSIAYEECKTYQQKYQFHKENAERCFKDAQNKCWWLPNIDHRDKARYCLTNLGSWAVATDLRSKVITVIVTTLIQYGLDCCDEWHYINEKLNWSKHHYELMEFYEGITNQKNDNSVNNTTQKMIKKNQAIPICNIKK